MAVFPFLWWPTELRTSHDASHGYLLSWLLPLAACAIIVAGLVAARRRGSAGSARPGRITIGLLAGLSALAALNYHDYGLFRYDSYVNEWDVYHYYLGTKYAPELGYHGLYDATVVADFDAGIDRPEILARSMSSYALVPRGGMVAEAERIRGRLGDRWPEFARDVAWFRDHFTAPKWFSITQDHGYNGTPAWSFGVGALLTRHLDITEPLPRFLLLGADPLLMVLMFAAVGWAFGADTALLLVVFVGTHYLFSWGHLKGGLLRVDFVAASVIAMCCLRRGRPKTAGVFLGIATASRIFPLAFAVGPFIRWLRKRRESGQWDPELAAFFGALTVTLVGVVVASIAYFGGTDLWGAWIAKIGLHVRSPSPWHVGYQTLVNAGDVLGELAYVDPTVQYREEPALLMQHRVTLAVVRFAVVAPALVFAQHLRPDRAFALGFVIFFMLSGADYYYYYVLAVPFVFFAQRRDQLGPALATIWMFLTGVAGYVFFTGWSALADLTMFQGWHQEFSTTYYLTWMVAVTVLWMVADAGGRARARERELKGPTVDASRRATATRPGSTSASAS